MYLLNSFIFILFAAQPLLADFQENAFEPQATTEKLLPVVIQVTAELDDSIDPRLIDLFNAGMVFGPKKEIYVFLSSSESDYSHIDVTVIDLKGRKSSYPEIQVQSDLSFFYLSDIIGLEQQADYFSGSVVRGLDYAEIKPLLGVFSKIPKEANGTYLSLETKNHGLASSQINLGLHWIGGKTVEGDETQLISESQSTLELLLSKTTPDEEIKIEYKGNDEHIFLKRIRHRRLSHIGPVWYDVNSGIIWSSAYPHSVELIQSASEICELYDAEVPTDSDYESLLANFFSRKHPRFFSYHIDPISASAMTQMGRFFWPEEIGPFSGVEITRLSARSVEKDSPLRFFLKVGIEVDQVPLEGKTTSMHFVNQDFGSGRFHCIIRMGSGRR